MPIRFLAYVTPAQAVIGNITYNPANKLCFTFVPALTRPLRPVSLPRLPRQGYSPLQSSALGSLRLRRIQGFPVAPSPGGCRRLGRRRSCRRRLPCRQCGRGIFWRSNIHCRQRACRPSCYRRPKRIPEG